MAEIERLLASAGLPTPVDTRAYTATLRLGSWVYHLLRAGSPQFIERVSPAGPALSPMPADHLASPEHAHLAPQEPRRHRRPKRARQKH